MRAVKKWSAPVRGRVQLQQYLTACIRPPTTGQGEHLAGVSVNAPALADRRCCQTASRKCLWPAFIRLHYTPARLQLPRCRCFGGAGVASALEPPWRKDLARAGLSSFNGSGGAWRLLTDHRQHAISGEINHGQHLTATAHTPLAGFSGVSSSARAANTVSKNNPASRPLNGWPWQRYTVHSRGGDQRDERRLHVAAPGGAAAGRWQLNTAPQSRPPVGREDFEFKKIGAAHQRAANTHRRGDAVEQPGKTRLRMAAVAGSQLNAPPWPCLYRRMTLVAGSNRPGRRSGNCTNRAPQHRCQSAPTASGCQRWLS